MKISTAEYIIQEVLHSLRRNSLMAFASVGTVAVSLFILGMFLILVLNLNRMTSELESQVEISVYINDETSDDDVDRLEDRIYSMPSVESVTFISRAKAMERFGERLGDQKFLLDALGESNPLPRSFEVRVTRPDTVKTTAEEISEMRGVETTKYGQDVVQHLFDMTRLIRLFGGALMFVLALATLFIISNTIRLTVFARRKEIAIMKYVGATDWFIRWPFLLEGITLGGLGGIVSALFLRVAYRMVTAKIYETLTFFPLIPENPLLHFVSLAIIACGMGIGALGSTISLKRFLKA